MNTTESMGRRACKDGDEVDYLPRNRDRSRVENHGLHAKVKVAHTRRTRRATRQALRTAQEA